MIQRNEDVLFCSLHFTGKLQVVVFPVTKRTVSEPFIRNEKFTPKVLLVLSNGRMTFVALALLMPKKSLPLW